MKVERVVLDTNVLISSVLSAAGNPRAVVDLAFSGSPLILLSSETFDEIVTRLARPKFDKYISSERRRQFIEDLRDSSEFVEISGASQGCRDPDDDKFLELAVVGRADAIVTGDKDLLVMHPFRDIPVLSPADFLMKVGA